MEGEQQKKVERVFLHFNDNGVTADRIMAAVFFCRNVS